MFFRSFPKIFSFAHKRSWLLSFSPKSFLTVRARLLHFTRSTATIISHPTVTQDKVPTNRKSQAGNLYIAQYLFNNTDIYGVVNTNNINLEQQTVFESLRLIKDFTKESELREVRSPPKNFIDCLKKELRDYGLEEIYKFIILISNCNSLSFKIQLLKCLDDELLRREFSVEDKLKILLAITFTSKEVFKKESFRFPYKTASKFCRRISQLTPQQALQVMFAALLISPEIIKNYKYNIQEYFASTIPQLNSDELGIIAAVFAKGEISFSHKELPIIIINKAMEEIENFHYVPLCLICQLFTSHLKHYHGNALLEFQEKVVPYVPKLPPLSVLNLAEAGLSIRCMNLLLWEALATSFKKNIDDYTIFWIQRMVRTTAIYDIKDDELLNLAIKKFETTGGDSKYFQCLISFLYHLALHKVHPEKLLNLILSKQFREEYNLDDMGFNTKVKYCFLNCCVELEKPTHNFELLYDKTRELWFKVLRISNNSDMNLWKGIFNIQYMSDVLKTDFGESSVFVTECLPHFGKGIVMRFDKTIKALPVPEEFRQLKSYYAKEPFKDDHFWIVIVLVPLQDFLFNTETPVLKQQTQIRQLEILGYKPILIRLSDWRKNSLNKTESEFLKNTIINKLEEVLQEKSR